MCRHPRVFALAAVSALISCGSDGVTGLVTVTVTGDVLDYFTTTAVSGASVTIEGAPSLNATTAADGAYTVANVPATESLLLVVSKGAYRPTRNVPVAATGGTVGADLAVVGVSDVQRQYTAVAVTPTAGMGVVFVELVDGSGVPRTGIPAAAITLVDATQSPAGDGPYFFGAAGDIVPQIDLSQSTSFGGRARTAFLNVPVGSYTLRIAAGSPTLIAPVVIASGGATLVER